jgi:hypothetical protein
MKALTQAEQAFVDHFSRERADLKPGPAHDWMRQNGLHYNYMDNFQYWCERNGSNDFLTRIVVRDNPLPSFQVPRSSREEVISRAKEITKIYPGAKTWLP